MTGVRNNRGLSACSILACIFAMLVTAILVQFCEMIEASANGIARHAVSPAAMMVFIPILLVISILSRATRFVILNRNELLAVCFCSLMAAPMASTGFWMMLVGPLGTIPKTAYFEVYDAYPKRLWPQSDNLFSGALDQDSVTGEQWRGGTPQWIEATITGGESRLLPILRNTDPGDTSAIRLSLPIAGPADTFPTAIVPGEPYLLSVLMRPGDLEPGSEYYCHVYTDGREHFDIEVFTGRSIGEVNHLHQTGFLRRGTYGVIIPEGTQGPVEIEIGLRGGGTLEIAECEMVSVGALDAIYRGRRVIDSETREMLPPGPLPHSLVESGGIRSMVTGNIPWGQWAAPFLSWYSFGALVLLGTLAIATIMHRQWVINERYPLPNTRIPMAILGGDDESQAGSLEGGIWSNRIMWIGFSIALFWCLMKGWHAYNSNVPDMNIRVDLSPYFTDSGWGRTWRGEEVRNVTFHVTAVILALAIFMELNVLFSLVLGFFLFRFQYFAGEATGMSAKQEFPYFREQQLGAFITYGLIIIFLARRHLWHSLKAGFFLPGDGAEHTRRYRAAWSLLVLCFAGAALWAVWTGIPMRGILVFFATILLVGLVAMKLRAECGVLTGWFTPIALAGIIPLTGGMVFHGPEGILFMSIASYALFQYLFFITPGMQLEMMEMGRKFKMPGRDIVGVLLLGTLGALLLTGLVHLSLGFGVGGDNYNERWPYMDKTFILHDYNMAIADANLLLLPEDAPERAAAGGFKEGYWGLIFGGGVTMILAGLRQAFSGFWFHPIGFIVGSTTMMELAWGSVLAAGVIRYITFKIGGSYAVRARLMPFFVGVFLGAITAHLVFLAINGYFFFYHPEIPRQSFGQIF
ncbi:MAG: hypothetical protein JJU11_12850 [Candidatus Sumerlaeia bacterium]|nr:hypothetical protein [Candidatus Sumerlaeia bacterium]